MAATAEQVRAVAYTPRRHFVPFHERDKRWSVIVAHRRAGKTVACVMDLLNAAVSTKKDHARYAYIAPYYSQAKQVAWDYLKRYSADIATKTIESELSVELFNGARVRLYGADNPDALRGIYLDGVVLDEYADMRPQVWGEIIRPLLTDRAGWAVFIGTPKGKNSFYDIWKAAQQDADWYSLTLKASETGLLGVDELADARKTMSPEQYEQEFECSFDAAVLGAIFAKYVAQARSQGRVTRVPWEPSALVHVAFDIGKRDATSLWFYQWVKQELRVIDFYEATGETVTHYGAYLRAKGYHYDTLWLPHDAEHEHAEADKTYRGALQGMGFKTLIVPNLPLLEGIDQAKLAIQRAWFDAEKCDPGLEALSYYRFEFNERVNNFKPTPVHDWSSHASDSWRYLALSLKAGAQKPKTLKYDLRGYV